MAPKRKQSTKSESNSDAESSTSNSTPVTKVAKVTKEKKVTVPKEKKVAIPKGPVVPLDSTLPNNTAFPVDLATFDKKGDDEIRISSWNVCGIKACEKKGLITYITAEDADILVLTETKTSDPKIQELSDRYPFCYWGEDPKKGYAGTAILSKLEPISVVFGLPTTEEALSESAGRIITLEFLNTYLVGTYVPNAGQGLKSIDKKVAWNISFEKYLRQLDKVKPVIWTGDINVVQGEKDIRNWKTNYNKTPGCTALEIEGIQSQLNPTIESGDKKCLDIWRELHPDVEGYYTYFSYKFQCRSKGIGWRLDTFICSERIMEKVKQCEIRLEVYGASDHVPIMLDILGPL